MKILLILSKTFGTLPIKVDDEDEQKILSFGEWSASKDRGKYYFHHRISKKEKITLHRFLMGFPRGKWVDHINKDTLDNRKSNLRICSNGANIRNGHLRPNNKTGHTGILFAKDQPIRPWQAFIRVKYKTILLGSFCTINEAIKIRKEAEKKYWNI